MKHTKNIRIALLCSAVVGLLSPSESYAYLHIEAGVVTDKPTDTGTAASYGREGGIGLGLEYGTNWFTFVDYGVGALYFTRKYEVGTYNVSSTWLEVPAVVRFWPIGMLGIGAGVYAAKAMGDLHESSNVTSDTFSSNPKFSDLHLSTLDVGYLFSVIYSPLPLLFIEGRYTASLFNASADTNTFKYNDLSLLVGLRLGGKGF